MRCDDFLSLFGWWAQSIECLVVNDFATIRRVNGKLMKKLAIPRVVTMMRSRWNLQIQIQTVHFDSLSLLPVAVAPTNPCSKNIISSPHTATSTSAMADSTAAAATEAPPSDLKSGPFSVLYNAVRGNTQVLVNVRNNHKLLGRVKAYDRHMNL